MPSKANYSDHNTVLEDLKKEIRDFVKRRKWDKFHNAKDLSEGMVIEAGELLEHFLWKSARESQGYLRNQKNKDRVAAELSDLLILAFNFADRFHLDITRSLRKKLALLERRYPAKKVFGCARKYRPL
ncbi:MAG: nucleotide pyrophosphohydrolase [Candidatus Omnitrophica bacterium]|nr:nucleotide pyrophosphohydrolase [Candidatus Omnitrophota bacterium]